MELLWYSQIVHLAIRAYFYGLEEKHCGNKASLMQKFEPKIMIYVILNWKRIKFSESH
jgi:hypothetical protein